MFFSTLLGGVMAFLLVILVDWLKKPKLVFKKGSQALDLNHRPPQYKIVHIKVKNEQKRATLIPIETSPALLTRASIRIGRESFFGKWASTPEPITVVTLRRRIIRVVNPAQALIPPREDIIPSNDDSEAVEVPIGIKFDGEIAFYGFNNESYLYNLKHQNLIFTGREYSGTLVLSASNIKSEKKFKIYNRSTSLDDFYLKLVE